MERRLDQGVDVPNSQAQTDLEATALPKLAAPNSDASETNAAKTPVQRLDEATVELRKHLETIANQTRTELTRAHLRQVLLPRYHWQVRARWRRERFNLRFPQLRLLPSILGLATRSVTTGFAAKIAPAKWREPLIQTSQESSAEMLQRMQRMYFGAPWITYTTWAAAVGIGNIASATLRTLLQTQIKLRIGDTDHARRRLERVPDDGFNSAMTLYLMYCEAAGYLRAGKVHVRPRWIDGVGNFPQNLLYPPETMSEALGQIDELYWSGEAGSVFKVIHVGDSSGKFAGPLTRTIERWRGRVREQVGGTLSHLIHNPDDADSTDTSESPEWNERVAEALDTWAETGQPRWIVMIPGTAHLTPASTVNPADTQSNLYEVLGYPSAVRYGVLRGILDAFTRAGIVTEAQQREQRVLLIGHSQGAMVAASLAADPQVPFQTVAVLSAGGPIGATPIPDSVSVLALRHTQDPVAAMDDPHTQGRRSTVVFERALEPVEIDTLYFAHEVTTYAQTADIASSAAKSSPSLALSRTTELIEDFLPQYRSRSLRIREASRSFVYEITQDLVSEPDHLANYQDDYDALCHHGDSELPILEIDAPAAKTRAATASSATAANTADTVVSDPAANQATQKEQ